MNSFLKKTFCFLLVSCLCVFAASLFLKVNAVTESVTFSAEGYSNGAVVTSYVGNSFSITCSSSTKYYDTGSAIRVYAKGTMTVSSENTITGITLSFGSGDGSNEITADVGTYSAGEWTGSATSVTFTVGGTSGHRRIASVAVTFDGAVPSVSVSGDVNVKLGTNPTYTATPVNISEPYTTTFATSNASIATITNAGVLTPVATGNVNVTATVNGTTSSNYAVRVWPAEPANISEAIAICTLAGSTATPLNYTVSGIITSIPTAYKNDKITVNIEDETGEIQCYQMAGGSDLIVGDYITVTGKLKKYSSTNEFDAGATYVKTNAYCLVAFNSQGGSAVTAKLVLAGSKVAKPDDPTKNGYIFRGWYKEEGCSNEWNFDSDTVTSSTTLYAKWEYSVISDFKILQTKATLKFDYNKVKTGTKEVYELYSGELTEGDYIIFSGNRAMNTTVTSNRLQYVEVTPVNDIIDTNNTAIIWHIAPSDDYWTIYNAVLEKYAASTGTKNQAQMLADGTDDKALWTVTGTSTYDFVNKNNAAASVNANLRNNGTSGFATYAAGYGGAIFLYKKITVNTYSYSIDQDLGGKNILSLQFRGIITSELKNSLEQNATEVKYGVLYGKTSDIESEFHGMNGLLTDFLNDGYWINEIEDLAPGKLRYTVIEANSLQGVDSTGTVEDNEDPEYYQFGVSINKISNANINTSITVAAYAYIDGTYYIMQAASYSVKTLASEYVNAADTSAYAEHLAALEYLASYGD